MTKLKDIAGRTQRIYEKNAGRFDAERSKVLFERPWLDRFAALLPAGGTVLDAGCGSGLPIAQHFIEQGYQVTGIDFAAPMLDMARRRFPTSCWLQADMRTLDLEARFDGIIAWHSFFHLTPEDQHQTIPVLAKHLSPKGVLMLTAGDQEGEVTGHVGDDVVYHSSLSREGYIRLLSNVGLDILSFVVADPDCDGATVLLARKMVSPA